MKSSISLRSLLLIAGAYTVGVAVGKAIQRRTEETTPDDNVSFSLKGPDGYSADYSLYTGDRATLQAFLETMSTHMVEVVERGWNRATAPQTPPLSITLNHTGSATASEDAARVEKRVVEAMAFVNPDGASSSRLPPRRIKVDSDTPTPINDRVGVSPAAAPAPAPAPAPIPVPDVPPDVPQLPIPELQTYLEKERWQGA